MNFPWTTGAGPDIEIGEGADLGTELEFNDGTDTGASVGVGVGTGAREVIGTGWMGKGGEKGASWEVVREEGSGGFCEVGGGGSVRFGQVRSGSEIGLWKGKVLV